jgi:hypothetical protein
MVCSGHEVAAEKAAASAAQKAPTFVVRRPLPLWVRRKLLLCVWRNSVCLKEAASVGQEEASAGQKCLGPFLYCSVVFCFSVCYSFVTVLSILAASRTAIHASFRPHIALFTP